MGKATFRRAGTGLRWGHSKSAAQHGPPEGGRHGGEYGLGFGEATRLKSEIRVFNHLGLQPGMARLKRNAESETKAAKDQRPGPGSLKTMAGARATAVLAPPVSRWIKSKGYDMEA